jgi:hypothetical protein
MTGSTGARARRRSRRPTRLSWLFALSQPLANTCRDVHLANTGGLDRAPRALPSCWRRHLPATAFAWLPMSDSSRGREPRDRGRSALGAEVLRPAPSVVEIAQLRHSPGKVVPASAPPEASRESVARLADRRASAQSLSAGGSRTHLLWREAGWLRVSGGFPASPTTRASGR